MDTRRCSYRSVSICFISLLLEGIGLYLLTACLLTACGRIKSITPTTDPVILPTLTLETSTTSPIAALPPLPTQTPVCVDNLTFVSDATIPDGTIFASGSPLDKQWLVQNSGSCNWDSRYRLRMITGDAMGATIEQAIYPARAGTQVLVRIQFNAPEEAGEYISEWQAFDADGIPFGDSFYIKITVQE
jgi:hypothetical protein